MGQAKKKQRECPAVGRSITGVECGENRASRYQCPVDCPHNPWSPAHYDLSLAVEDSVQAKMFQRLREELGGPLPAQEVEELARMSDLGRQLHFIRTFQLDRDAQGRSFAERWAAAGLAGLNNDERNFLRWKTSAQLRLLEIVEVRAGGQCVARDLLEPAAGLLILQDRTLQMQALRFVQLLGWTFATPHYTRVLGIAPTVPEVTGLDGHEMVRLVVEHLGGPTETVALRAWLAVNLPAVAESFAAIVEAQRYQMLKSVDARFTKISYRLTGKLADVLRRLDEDPAVQPDEASAEDRAEGYTTARVWFDEAAPAEAGQAEFPLPSVKDAIAGRPLLGRVLLGQDTVRLDAGSGARAAALRARFEKRVGRWVEYVGERVDDLGAKLMQEHAAPDPKLVPPLVLEKAPRFVMMASQLNELPPDTPPAEAEAYSRRRHDELFLDDHVPALNGLTPRLAAADPQWRPVLVKLMKQRIRGHDQRNLETGDNYDANWLVQELGLTEVLFPPPPPRPIPAMDPGDEFGDEEEEEWSGLNEALPESPRLAGRPFTEAELEQRLARARASLGDPTRALTLLQDEAPEIYELLDGALPEAATDADFMVTVSLGTIVWQVFVPPGTRGWWVEPDLFFDRLVHRSEAITRDPRPGSVERMIENCRQPVLATHVAGLLAQMVTDKRKQVRLDPIMSVMMITVLVTLIDELDRAGRA